MQDIKLDNFLKVKEQFSLGQLTTESFHPLTSQLSKHSEDTIACLNLLKEVDNEALKVCKAKEQQLAKLHKSIKTTLESGSKIFICGCGATGRLAISLEFLFRQKFKSQDVISFMAGGDFALIKSVESFEDYQEYGARMLQELGFEEGDLLISITEGGETSYVIGAALKASSLSSNRGFFLYCNPDDELKSLDRCRKVFQNEMIHKVNLTCGPMAISGSTRMQATTVQMFFCGSALLSYQESEKKCIATYQKNINELIDFDYSFMHEFTEAEAQIVKDNGVVTYQVCADLAICILTDTTERNPTFSLLPFENIDDTHLSLSFLTVKNTKAPLESWRQVLARDPRGLDWDNFSLSKEDILKFDLSEKSLNKRDASACHEVFVVDYENDKILIGLGKKVNRFQRSESLFIDHLKLKMAFNAHSSLMMCKLGRVEGNMMSYVKPSNLKLIDRAIRYCVEILKGRSLDYSYEQVAKVFFEQLNNKSESIVLAVVEELDNS